MTFSISMLSVNLGIEGKIKRGIKGRMRKRRKE